jgi:hypothetical protein
MTLDPTSDIGKIRLRIADYSDLPLLNDAVISATLADCGGNVPKAAKTCATYILGMLAHKTHRKMAQLEVWGAESFLNYSKFLLLTVSNPNFMDCSPIPYSANAESNPLLDFQRSWNQNFYAGTETQQSNSTASYSPNDGSKFGPFGGF